MINRLIKIFIIGLFAVGCNTPQRLNKMMDKLPEAAAKECAQRYPIKESIDTVTVTDSASIKNYQSELFLLWKQLDSVITAGCDTLYIDKIKKVFQSVPSKPIIKHIIKTQENTAKLAALESDCNKTIKSLSEANAITAAKLHQSELKVEKLKRRNIWLWLMIVLMTIFAFRKQLIRGL